MPPSLRRSSMRYFPASVVPTSKSGSFSSADPSDGQSVVASGYSTPHLGHFFINVSLSPRLTDQKHIHRLHRFYEINLCNLWIKTGRERVSSVSQPRRSPATRTAPMTRSAPGRESSSFEYVRLHRDCAPRLHTPTHRYATVQSPRQTPRSRNRHPQPARDTYLPNSHCHQPLLLPVQTRSCCS